MKGLLTKLAKIRKELQGIELKKSGYNAFSKFKYFELEDFLPIVNNLEDKIGLFSKFQIEKTEDGQEFGVLDVYDIESGDAIKFSIPSAEVAIKGAQPIQNVGGKNTYLKKYTYFNYLNLSEINLIDKESGSAEQGKPSVKPKSQTKSQSKSQPEQQPEQKRLVTEAQVEVLESILEKERIDNMLKFYKINSLDEMDFDEAIKVIQSVQKN